MSSFEHRYYRENPTLIEKTWRNTTLLWMLFLAALAWLFKGYRLRRAVRKAERSGEPVLLEDWMD